ncbi:lipase [Chlorella sorokiniana]|uniref:Lipase n=1 Tax=Chlorella sorokiniana TaxID=3076 RepID=A0A2P6TIV8_CHLSO|nr:lipase [Chlorella sorokiniana]|eukprot:PRW39183.1 lipase [Chlorella sorokiniana]
MLPKALCALALLTGLQCIAGQTEGTDWGCGAESQAAAGQNCGTYDDTSCSGIFAQAPEVGGRTASYLASLLADMAYEPTTGTWEDTARTILPKWGATDVQFISKTTVDSEVKADTQVVVADSPAAVLVFFRGTEITKLEDIQTDLSTKFVDVSGLGRVHEGFYKAEDIVHADITSLLDQYGAGSKPVIYVGHSLGGALANIAAARQQLASPGSVSAVYTYGGPRVGDAAWADAYNNLGLSSITYRYVLGKDPIPLIPPGGDIGFVHVGQQMRISSSSCAADDANLSYCDPGSPISGTLGQALQPESGLGSFGAWLVEGVCTDTGLRSKLINAAAGWLVNKATGIKVSLSVKDLTHNEPGICCSELTDHLIQSYKQAIKSTCMGACDAEKEPYVKKAEADKARYEKEKAKYEAKKRSLTLVSSRWHAIFHAQPEARPRLAPPLPAQFAGGFKNFTFALDWMQVAGTQLKLCSLQRRQPAQRWAPDSSRPSLCTLTLGHAQQMPRLQQFVQQLLPAGGDALECLVLRHCTLGLGELFGCSSSLSQLRELVLSDSSMQEGWPLPDAVAVLLHQARRLSGLTLCNEKLDSPGVRLQAVPPCVAAYSGRTYLSLRRQGLWELPDGAYLPSLRCLDLMHNDFTELPPALTACTALTCLALDYNWRMLLRHSDLVTLGAVRGLLRFEAEYVKDEEPGFCHALHALLPRLRIKFRASNLVTPSWGMH